MVVTWVGCYMFRIFAYRVRMELKYRVLLYSSVSSESTLFVSGCKGGDCNNRKTKIIASE
jgi:hypothetical protein